MANKSMELPDQSQLKRVKKKRKWVKSLIGISILGAIGGALYVNRDKVAIYTKDIPLLNIIFSVEANKGEGMMSLEEATRALEEANSKVDRLEEDLEKIQQENDQLNIQVEQLKEYEQSYSDFEQQKASWDEEIARTNPELFIEQFELMHPELSETLYLEFKVVEEWHKEYNQYANMIGNMDEKKAAAALEKLLATETVLIQQIFEHMNMERQALILNQMSTDGATQIIKLISP